MQFQIYLYIFHEQSLSNLPPYCMIITRSRIGREQTNKMARDCLGDLNVNHTCLWWERQWVAFDDKEGDDAAGLTGEWRSHAGIEMEFLQHLAHSLKSARTVELPLGEIRINITTFDNRTMSLSTTRTPREERIPLFLTVSIDQAIHFCWLLLF